jgi:hypothetical protein
MHLLVRMHALSSMIDEENRPVSLAVQSCGAWRAAMLLRRPSQYRSETLQRCTTPLSVL